ncbi:hypothetical protein OOK60_00485 [Trichothermofontia sichuanensis B231]|uniref:hypothetical protein n=1 Tax=Trichothermofontia sichuanensis TaxID=3045816 RepID=UPI00224739D9|nr:hypothetical protein [Trichothermofontia sichuanensis]UZQ54589.1 hypothetical protein OOK60_00485 [Trichothermofontia sichuanensis B231]
MSAKNPPLSSEAYRQMLVKDGERRFREWHGDFLRHQQAFRASLAAQRDRYIPSETYRQMLVRDGERRFREWHQNYLNYQKQYLTELAASRRS